ncbi:MAG: methyltransferase [Bacteroidales bacterium]|nr:methyltransferase [Bacteroidales bacterium]
MKKLSITGIGPKIGRVALPYFLITLILSIYFKEIFDVGPLLDKPLLITGVVLLVIGVIFWGITGRLLLKGIKTTTLMTTGTYYLCQNPLYASMILMIFPGLSFVLHTWLILTTSLVAYTLFKIHIKQEYRELESVFGEAYLSYRTDTPEIIPLPFKKWSKKNSQ